MNTTIVIQTGNSDNKLTQEEWSHLVGSLDTIINMLGKVHFFGAPPNWFKHQNACWVFEIETDKIPTLKKVVVDIRKRYRQDSLAFMEGETQFI